MFWHGVLSSRSQRDPSGPGQGGEPSRLRCGRPRLTRRGDVRVAITDGTARSAIAARQGSNNDEAVQGQDRARHPRLEPDWEPYLAPKAPDGAPNVLILAWDDLGYATMDMLRRSGRVPEHAPHRRPGREVLELPHHRAVLADARVAADGPQRDDATAWRRSPSSRPGFPGISTRIPFENGFISEVLAEHGLQHLLRRQVAPHAGRGVQPRRVQGPMAARARASSASTAGSAARRTRGIPTSSTTTTRSSRRAGPRTATTWPTTWPTRRSSSSATPRSSTRTSRSSCTSRRRPVTRRTSCRSSGPTGTRASSTRATRRSAPGSSQRQIELGSAARGHRAVADQPARRAGAHRSRRPAVAAARHRAAVGLADRRRAAPVRAHGRGVRRLHLVLRRPARPRPRLPRGVGPARQHAHRRGLRQRRQRRGRPERQRSTSGASSTACRHHRDARCPHIDELGTPASYNHYNTGWAWALDTPFPYWKRWAGDEGGVADMCIVVVAGADHGRRTEIRHQYVHAVDVVPTVYDLLGIEPPEVIKGYPQSPIEGESFAAALTDPTVPGKRTQFYTMLGQRSIYHDGWLACTVHPPLCGLGQLRARRVGAVPPRGRPRAVEERRRRRARRGSRRSRSLWFYYAGIYNGLPLDDRSALEQVLAERPHGGADREQYIYYPDCADVPESAGVAINGRSYTIAAGVDIDSADAEGVLCAARRRRRRPQPLRQGQASCATRSTGSARTLQTSSPTATSPRAPRAHRRVRGQRAEHRPEHARHRRHADALRRRPARSAQGEIVTQPGDFCLVGDGICVGRDSASPVTPEYDGTVPVHRRHHRQGRRRRLRRALRRPRGPGPRLVQRSTDRGAPR